MWLWFLRRGLPLHGEELTSGRIAQVLATTPERGLPAHIQEGEGFLDLGQVV